MEPVERTPTEPSDYAAISAVYGALLAATDDRLHQPYRATAMPVTAALVAQLRAAGHAAFVSGAGPTVLVLAADEVEVEAVRRETPEGWRAEALAVDRGGARVVGGE